jgi:CubicO group peptidase (beta-lactamase class C family)
MSIEKIDIIEDLENYIFQKMTISRIPGLSVAAVHNGKLLYAKGFGFRDLDLGTSATPRTLYCLGSVTKSFTALAIIQLCEEGLLKLEDPIEKYISFKERPMGESIQIKHLLSHTSGIPSLGYAVPTLSAVTGFSDRWLPISNPQDLLVFMGGAEKWAISKPGLQHAYMNAGYILLGSIIKKVSGESYANYIKNHILNPLRMNRSSFSEDEVKTYDDVATPYISRENNEKIAIRYPYGQLISDGGLMSNSTDMVNYMNMLLSKGEFEGNRLASSESIENMMNPKIMTIEEPIDAKSYNYYGYGLRIKTEFLGYNLIHHSGSVYGSSAYMGIVPEKNIGIIVFANSGYYLGDVGEYALALFLDRNPKDLLYFKRVGILDSLTGKYKTFRDTMNINVIRNGGLLQLEFSYAKQTHVTTIIPVDLEGESKLFKVYGVDSTTPVEFVQRNGEIYMIYERTKAKKL